MEKDCIFCKVVQGAIPSKKVTESANFIVIKDVYPRVKGHSLVIPKEHYDTFEKLPTERYQEFLETAKKAVDILSKEFRTKRFNYAMVGDMVRHLHLHILPRKEGDGFDLAL